MSEITTRPATIEDVVKILGLVNELAATQVMLPRSPASVIENIRDFIIADVDGEFAGCGALAVVWSDIAEIRSIAVSPKAQKLGIGKRIATALIDEARRLGIPKVFAFTYVQTFFEKLEFSVVEHEALPHKVFNDCLNCPKYQACDEIAMQRVLDPDAAQKSVPYGLPLPSRR